MKYIPLAVLWAYASNKYYLVYQAKAAIAAFSSYPLLSISERQIFLSGMLLSAQVLALLALMSVAYLFALKKLQPALNEARRRYIVRVNRNIDVVR